MSALTRAARHRQANRDADGAVQHEHDPIEGVEFHGPCDALSAARRQARDPSPRARTARSLRMTAPGGYGRRERMRRKERLGFLPFPSRTARERVILSAAGAKDLVLGGAYREPVVRQVLPCGIFLLDQPRLSCANPALELLFAGDGVANITELLEVNQPRDVVLAREASREAALVLINPPHEVVGDARV